MNDMALPSEKNSLVQLPEAAIEYYDLGDGEPVVMLPGGSLNVTYMQPLAEALARAGYRVIRVNPRGAGYSMGTGRKL